MRPGRGAVTRARRADRPRLRREHRASDGCCAARSARRAAVNAAASPRERAGALPRGRPLAVSSRPAQRGTRDGRRRGLKAELSNGCDDPGRAWARTLAHRKFPGREFAMTIASALLRLQLLWRACRRRLRPWPCRRSAGCPAGPHHDGFGLLERIEYAAVGLGLTGRQDGCTGWLCRSAR